MYSVKFNALYNDWYLHLTFSIKEYNMNFDIIKLDESNNRRVFYIDLGNVSKEQIEKIIKELVDSKKIPINIGIFFVYI